MEKKIVSMNIITSIWTGNENKKNALSIRETGILGSLRWWYESIIRGLGGSACLITSKNSNCQKNKHCNACELFGCLGWSRKFKLDAETVNMGKKKVLNLRFIELRYIEPIEWALLNLTLKIISQYGALGGKIADSKYGLVELNNDINDLTKYSLNIEELNLYFEKKNIKRFQNPNFSRFISIQNFNLEDLKELKNKFSFLKGNSNQAKRYFLKKTREDDLNRLFIFANNQNEYEKIIDYSKRHNWKLIEGEEILRNLSIKSK
ncbi:type III-B CRISPR module RAMP protein Cmr1 [Candidatus Harpocratesius sp.]